MKKLLVPVDFSEVSKNAAKLAIELAEKTNAEVTLLNSVKFYYFTDYEFASFSGARSLMDDVRDSMEEKMAEFKEELDCTCELTTVVKEDSLVACIKDMVKDEQFDLIVIGTHGSSGLEEAFIGSNTEKVVRHAECPVISVPGATELKDIHKIMVPLDIEEIKPGFLQKIASLQQQFDVELNFLWVKTPHNIENENKVSGELSDVLESFGITNFNFTIVRNVFPADGILMHAYDTEVDMIAMPTHARRGLSHWLYGSLTEDTVNHIQMPVWSFKMDKKEKSISLDSVKNAHGKPEYKKIEVLTS